MILVKNVKKGLFKRKKDEAEIAQGIISLLIERGYTGHVKQI